jgi:hypothetical protein
MRSEEESRIQSDAGGARAEGELGTLGEERISLGDPRQVQEWATKLGVSQEHLRELVAQVGPRVSDLQQRLSQPEIVD